MNAQSPIGVFDSGLGGVSVLREAMRLLPGEDFLYYGDSANAPYGVRPTLQIRSLVDAAAARLFSQGIKALVIACNTATSADISFLREAYPGRIVIGTEPALKPAVERFPGGRILVMATPLTLQEEKFARLRQKYRQQAEIIPVACEGLMEFVERGELEGPALQAYLSARLAPYLQPRVDAVVLGCTHYPFLKPAIRAVLGPQTALLDGGAGIAAQLARRLEAEGLLNRAQARGLVTFQYSLPSEALLQRDRALLALRE